MTKTERIITLWMLFVLSFSNVAVPVVYAAQKGESSSSSVTTQANTFAPAPQFAMPDSGSVLGASTSLLTVGSQSLNLLQGNQGSAHQRTPIQMQKLTKKVFQSDEPVTLAVTNPDNEAFTTTVADATGKAVPVPISESNNGITTTVQLAPSNELKPGKYSITVTDTTGRSITQDFTWGVLALNTDKSMYHPGETADIAMAVLNDKGDMVCDAKVQLRITNDALRIADTLSTDNGKITINPQCQKHDFSLQPDYEAHYTFGGVGEYQFTLSAATQNGTHTISDTIQVKDQIPFDVQRVSATRLYPPNTYPMTFHIKANRDFTGTVTETVPDSFTITPATASAHSASSGPTASVNSYNNMQTVYLNSQDPTQQLQQTLLNSGDMLVMPFQGNYPITQGFGVQLTDPLLQSFYSHYGLAGHDGVDFGVPMHTPLYAVDEGDIVWSGPGDYGTTVIIQHSWGKSYYGHLSNTSVTLGQHVTKGQLIGYSGESGEATGPHLHFGMKPNNPDMTNGYYGKIDPLPYLPYGHQAQAMAIHGPTIALAGGTAVLGASASAVASSSASVATATPTPTAALSPTSVPTVTPTAAPATPSVVSTVTPPTPTATPSLTTTPAASSGALVNSQFTVLDKEILTNEQLAANAQTQKVKVITWHVSLKKGESTSLGYAYQTPKVSPEFYLLGPVKFYESGSDKVIFQEQRQWQLANDDVGVEWYQNTTGHPWNGYSWQYRKKITISHSLVSTSASAEAAVTFMESGSDATHDLSLYASSGAGAGSSIASDCTMSNTGPCSIKAVSAATKAYVDTGSGTAAGPSGRISGYFYFDTLPSGSNNLPFFTVQDASGNNCLDVEITNDVLKFNSSTGTGTTPIQADTWYRISVGYTITGTNTYHFILYLNGKTEIDTSNSGAQAGSVPNHMRIGDLDTNDANTTIHFDDIYADSGTDLFDPGDIHVTAKRPYAQGTQAGLTTEIGSGGSGYPSSCTIGGGCHAQQENERPINTANGWSGTGSTSCIPICRNTSNYESYNVESASQGDVDISTAGMIAYSPWVDASATTSCTADIIVGGFGTGITLTTSYAAFSTVVTTTTYPTTDSVEFATCVGTSTTSNLAEAGVQIAYVPTLENFPTLISISGDSALAAHAQSNGNDILFTEADGKTKLDHQIEHYSSGTLVAWVNIPQISSSTDTIIYMYYGNPAASSQQNATGVWSNYDAVWHMGSPTSLSLTDSSGNGNTGTNTGATAATGQIYGGASFNGTSNYINFGNGASLNNSGTNSTTIEAWYKESTYTANIQLFIHGTSNTQGFEALFSACTSTVAVKAQKYGVNETTANQCIGTLPTNTSWHHFVLVYDPDGERVYIDGVLTNPVGSDTQNFVSTTQNMYVGYDNASSTHYFTGIIDEFRVLSNGETPGWIATEYNNQNSPGTFATVNATEETSIYAPTLDKLMRHGKWFDSTGTEQPFTF